MQRIAVTAIMFAALEGVGMASELVLEQVESDLVPSPVEYAILLPADWKALEDLPLVLSLHGGGGNRDQLGRLLRPVWDRLWESGAVPPMAVVTPSATARGFYMDTKDGSERWESFLIDPFIAHLRSRYPLATSREKTFLIGASMGGMGGLRMAFKHPERFAAVAALEPGIEPVLEWQDMQPKHRFWRDDTLFEQAFGKPVDPAYWAANNPASIAAANPARIRESGLAIYLEAGDEDQFWLYEGAEFLHQVLWDNRIRHEYHLVRGADHVGASLLERYAEGIRFLARTLNPWPEPRTLRFLERQKRRTGEKDHYNQL
jgi:S-formylglutathione hydrolase